MATTTETADPMMITLDDESEARLIGVTAGEDFSELAFYGVQGDEAFPVWFDEYYERVFKKTDEDMDTDLATYAVKGLYGEDEETWERAADEELAWYGLKLGERHRTLKVGETVLQDCYDLLRA